MRPLPWLGLLATSLLIPSCGSSPDAGRPNVLMVVIDTARADRFGSYGHTGGLTPHIDKLAQAGAVFENASAHAPWTLPSTASLLTSRHPQQHGAGGWLDLSPMAQGLGPEIKFRGLQEAQITLAEVLSEGGWNTGAVINVDFLDKAFGLTQGIDDLDARWYESNDEVRGATETTDKAITWIEEQGDAPFFLLVHYFDVHAVYDPPTEFRKRFAAPVDRENSNFTFGTRSHMLMLRGGRLELEEDTIERAERLYEAELAYVDAQVGRLLQGLADSNLVDNTLVVLTADHGEEFLDHGGFEHGHSLYQELVHVPLVLSFPGQIKAGMRFTKSLGLVDVAPTICDLLQIESPASFVGHSQAPALAGGQQQEWPVLSYGNFWGAPLLSWRSGDWKLIITPGTDGTERVELFNMDTDPFERENLATQEPDILSQLRSELEQVSALHAAEGSGKSIELDAATRQRLKDLGYMGDEDQGQ